MKKIRDFLERFIEKRVQKRTRKKMIDNYNQNYQVEILLEQWIVKRILDGHTDRRKELAEKQARIKEMRDFIKYLRNLK